MFKMTKGETIKFLKQDHQKLLDVVSNLTVEQLTSKKIIENWTVKDILAHISAWNKAEIKAIDLLLRNEKPFYIGGLDNRFNEKAVRERKHYSFDRVYLEFENSFKNLIEKITSLTEEEWKYQTSYVWDDEKPLTVDSLFYYTYEGAGHEGGHAKQIREKLKMKD